MKVKAIAALIHCALGALTLPVLADTGPSTTTAPYVLPLAPDLEITSILTTGDRIGTYTMGGIPDGLGAYENDDGTFTDLKTDFLARYLAS